MTTEPYHLAGQLVDIEGRRVYAGELIIQDGLIKDIRPLVQAPSQFILPGFIDAHVHIESSMLVPSEFARLAVVHGTVATVSDPHEIANVLGIPGVEYMIENGRRVPFKFYFGAPSCVPATAFETAGAELGPDAIDSLLSRNEIRYLAEMMNWPGVINGDPMVLKKLALARKYGKPVDGHAPGLSPDQAEAYIRAGIQTDHECVGLEEAKHKLSHGMKILIREGSAARNFEALVPLLHDHEDDVMFCSDDKHPDSLVEGHINQLVKRALVKGIDGFSILKAACVNPVKHFGLDVGLLRVGDPADFIVVDDLKSFNVMETFVQGQRVAAGGKSIIPSVSIETPNNFHARELTASDLQIKATAKRMRVIEAHDGQLITTSSYHVPKVVNGFAISDPAADVLKIAVVNRYKPATPAVAFIRNFGLSTGAIASCVAHDSHNIVVVGADDASMVLAVNAIVRAKGGISLAAGGKADVMPLPVAGIMSAENGYTVARKYQAMDQAAKALGSTLRAPYMTLSFMALLVIPELKLSDKGLFDGGHFRFVDLFV